jgi:hypothetical protein
MERRARDRVNALCKAVVTDRPMAMPSWKSELTTPPATPARSGPTLMTMATLRVMRIRLTPNFGQNDVSQPSFQEPKTINGRLTNGTEDEAREEQLPVNLSLAPKGDLFCHKRRG